MTTPTLGLPSTLDATLRWDGLGSPATFAVVAAVAVVWVAAIYKKKQPFVSGRRRTLLALLRLAAVAVLLTMLAQPTIERRRVALPRVVFLIDNSASMDARDVAAADLGGESNEQAFANTSRLDAARRLLAAGPDSLLQRAGVRYRTETLQFSDVVAPATDLAVTDDSIGDRGATRLGDAIEHALRQLPGPRPAAVVALTDGINTAGVSIADAANRARTLGVPLHMISLGSDRARADVSIADAVVEEVVFPGDRLQIEAAVRAVGHSGEASRVTLRRAADGAPIAAADVTLPADGQSQAVRLALRPTEPGRMDLVLEVDPASGEEDLVNNRVALTVTVEGRPIRALLVDSTPSFEFRALKSMLRRDAAVDLRILLQDADANFVDVEEAAVGGFPSNEAELLEYDVVLLGDADPRLAPPQSWALLEKFVSVHGGGLGIIAGPRFMPAAFADLEPMLTLLPIDAAVGLTLGEHLSRTGGLRIQPTPAGLQDPSLQLGETPDESAAIWAALPPVAWWLDPARPKPGALVLASGVPAGMSTGAAASQGGAPVIMRHHVGAGEVLLHATDETWRWRWRNDDRFFARYWGQAVRRLARGRVLHGGASLTTDRTEYEPADTVTLRLRRRPSALRHDDATVELAGELTPTRTLHLERSGADPHRFEITLRNLPPDRYTARLATPDGTAPVQTEFTVSQPPAELARLAPDRAALNEAAAATGGKVYTAATAGELIDALPAAAPVTVEQLPDAPLFNSPWILTLLCATLGLEWFLRRRSGML